MTFQRLDIATKVTAVFQVIGVLMHGLQLSECRRGGHAQRFQSATRSGAKATDTPRRPGLQDERPSEGLNRVLPKDLQ